MLRGRHTATVDVKGRLKIPAEFKAAFDEMGYDYFVTSLDGQSAWVYPMPEWEKIEAKLKDVPSMNPAREKFVQLTNFWGQEATLDAQGRILIPSQLRESAALAGEVAVMGNSGRLDVWNLSKITQHLAGNGITREEKAQLGDMGI
ncbi:MAG TPA: division/cell wall cluster transcriptional repressor MraZ [Terriglobia bacterium]|nr:division/cell wall cluster transcriptional repressor MraZ [Terriglobia bacterium]